MIKVHELTTPELLSWLETIHSRRPGQLSSTNCVPGVSG